MGWGASPDTKYCLPPNGGRQYHLQVHVTTIGKGIKMGGQSAMVVGDDSALRCLTSAILRQQGFVVAQARLLEEARQAFDNDGDSTVLLIANLDTRHAENVIGLALGLRARHQRLKVILTSASSPPRIELEIMQGAGISFLSLPYSFSRFSRAVSGVAGGPPRTACWSDVDLPTATAPGSHDLAASAVIRAW